MCITNFPETLSELFQACNQYGHVVDSYIPNKKSKIGKRFGFVRFINVFSEERLINNLCTVWIDRYKIHANIARFQRSTGKKEGDGAKKSFVFPAPKDQTKTIGKSGEGNSYMGVLKKEKSMETEVKNSGPSIVLGDDCVMSKILSNALFGRVKEFASLANLKLALGNEGFMDIVIKYMGELWVMLEFKTVESKLKFKESISVMSWFSQVNEATTDFEVEGRIAWVEVEGIPFRLWTGNTFARIADKWGKLLDVDDQEETCFHSKRLCIHMKSGKSINEEFKIIHRGKIYWVRANETPGWVPDFNDEIDDDDANSMDDDDVAQKPGDIDENSDGERVPNTIFEDEDLVKSFVEGKHSDKKLENSEDPFKIYSLLNRKNHLEKNENVSDSSLKYPPGFTPSVRNSDEVRPKNKEEVNDAYSECCEINSLKGNGNGSFSSGHFKESELPRSGGSMIGLLEEVVKVGQVMGYKMEGCISNMEEIIGSQGVEEAIQETKMEKIDDFCVKQCWGNLVFDHVHSEAVGNSGGILCVWDPNSFCKSNVTLSDYFVINRGHWRLTGKKMMIVAVYAPQESKEKQSLWGFLQHEIGKWNGDVIIMGDFNEVRFKSDRFGSHFNPYGAQRFNSFISSSGLVEVTLGGSHFTWCHKSATKMSKLDRFLVSESVLSVCPNINAITLERFLSDHRPILLKENRYDYGPTPFRFFHHWLEIDGFPKFVEDTWKSSPSAGSNALSILMSKLRFLKKHIRIWNKTNMGCRKNALNQLKKKLEVVDSIIDSGQGNEEMINTRLDIIHQIQKFDSLDSMETAQKAKIKWAVEGDENTGFFHGIINKRRSIQNIRGVMVEGTWIDNPVNVKKEFLDHFANRFSKPGKPTASLLVDFPNQISPDQRTYLESDVTNVEIKKAVWECGMDKAPGPDGFTFGFFRHFWYLVDRDVYEAVRYFFIHSDLPKGRNSSFIALIPKIPDANLVKDFRPISLIGSIYKIIAKFLTNRLVGVLGGIINEVQSAFIEDRQILDGPFILNEVISWCKRKRKQTLLFKVDFEKAYDSVRWDFLDDVLSKFGFGEKWRKWIHCCLHSSKGSIIINGSLTDEFQFGKGLKQGDPLSPFLFLLIMETLHISFKRVVDAGMYQGIKVGGLVNLSHMFYADDVVFVGEWSESNISSLMHVLDCFHKVSGLKINMSKSKIMGIEVDSGRVSCAAAKLGCLVLKTPFLYLGSYVGGDMHRLQSWDDIVDRVRRRLSKWKMKMLSIGGRLTLVKSVLGSMPIFHMSMFKVPTGTLRILESIRGKFFNGHEISSKKASWVQWNKVLAPKVNGGLGVSSLYALNRGLLFKWVWRFLAHDSTLWTRVIKAIHGDDGNIGGVPRNGVNTCWTNIINEIKVLAKKGINLLNFMHMKLGNGHSTIFWEDGWCESGRLKDRFPRAYALENCKRITVGNKLAHHSLTYSFRREPRGGVEKSQVEELVAMVQSVNLTHSQDRWTWLLNKSGEYTVASSRNLIDSRLLPKGELKTRWIRYVPIKVNTLAWKVMTNSLPTRFNISRRGIDIDSISCVNCDSGVETTNHLFFTCDMAKQVSQLIARWWDVPFIDIDSYGNWRTWIDNIRLPNMNKNMLEGVFFVMWWLLWNFRNKKMFEDNIPSKATFLDEVICKSFYWCRYRSKALFSWNDWFKNPSLISL
ncbi:RNA-directed DNA polymerase, eukaryota [Tanacetum coccineum]